MSSQNTPPAIAALQAFVDAKAGENEHGVYWQTSKLREAYALAEAVVQAGRPLPWWMVQRPDHMRGWECFGVTGDKDPTLRRLGVGYDGKGEPGNEKWGPGEVRLGVSSIYLGTFADHTAGALIHVDGPEKDDVERRWHLANKTWNEIGERLWPKSRA